MKNLMNSILKNEVHRVYTPNGTLFAIIVENEDGSVNSFQFSIGKAGNDVAPWANAVADLMNLFIDRCIKL